LWDARGVWQSVIDKEVMVLQKRNECGESGLDAAEKLESTVKSGILKEARTFFQDNPLWD
jgi:hypothetical protein